MTPMMLRIDWDDNGGFPMYCRYYADSWSDVQHVLDELLETGARGTIRRIVWPDEDDGR